MLVLQCPHLSSALAQMAFITSVKAGIMQVFVLYSEKRLSFISFDALHYTADLLKSKPAQH